jgi:hypothetical protein
MRAWAEFVNDESARVTMFEIADDYDKLNASNDE